MSREDGLPVHEIGDQLLRTTDELADKFHGVFSRETGQRFVEETFDLLDAHATVKMHLASLTARKDTDGISVHHVRRLADLDRPRPAWAEHMARRRRKTLVVCRPCHDAIHAGQPTPQLTQ